MPEKERVFPINTRNIRCCNQKTFKTQLRRRIANSYVNVNAFNRFLKICAKRVDHKFKGKNAEETLEKFFNEISELSTKHHKLKNRKGLFTRRLIAALTENIDITLAEKAQICRGMDNTLKREIYGEKSSIVRDNVCKAVMYGAYISALDGKTNFANYCGRIRTAIGAHAERKALKSAQEAPISLRKALAPTILVEQPNKSKSTSRQTRKSTAHRNVS